MLVLQLLSLPKYLLIHRADSFGLHLMKQRLPLKLFWPDDVCPVLTVPICINTVQFPLPSAKRCYKLGQAVGDAIRSWDSDLNVVVVVIQLVQQQVMIWE